MTAPAAVRRTRDKPERAANPRRPLSLRSRGGPAARQKIQLQ
jgi:hypothetical protein